MISISLQALTMLLALVGGPSPLLWSLAWSVWLAGSLISICGAGLLSMTVKKSWEKSVSTKANGPEYLPAKATGSIIPAAIKATAKQALIGILLFGAGCAVGSGVRDNSDGYAEKHQQWVSATSAWKSESAIWQDKYNQWLEANKKARK